MIKYSNPLLPFSMIKSYPHYNPTVIATSVPLFWGTVPYSKKIPGKIGDDSQGCPIP